MTTPIVRITGTALTPVTISSTASAAYSSAAMRVQQSALSTAGMMLADFNLTSITWGGVPTGGAIQLVAVDRDFSGTAGNTPSSTAIPRVVGTFMPQELTNTSPGVMSLPAVSLSPDADYYVFNNSTGQTFAATLNCTPWTPGT